MENFTKVRTILGPSSAEPRKFGRHPKTFGPHPKKFGSHPNFLGRSLDGIANMMNFCVVYPVVDLVLIIISFYAIWKKLGMRET